MERNTLVLLLIHLLFYSSSAVGNSSRTISRVFYFSNPISWLGAQNFCRVHHTDLVTIRNTQQAELLSGYEAWIGLYLAPDKTWKWSKGDEIADLNIWKFDLDRVMRTPPAHTPPGGPRPDEHCAMQSDSIWESEECDQEHPFLCTNEKWILVQELKTWEEALLHCRQLQTPVKPSTHRSDLASLLDASKSLLEKVTMRLNAQTDEVWVGLRFLAGKWLWVNKEPVTSSQLPRCPDEEEHCGALASENMNLQIMKCSERRNFLCSITT